MVYHNLADLDTRIRLEHNSSLFKKWGRIAKALEIFRLFSTGNSIESLTEIDSNPKDFIKTATFYHSASEIQGENFKKLVREGKGETGGKTIIFERLFRERKLCGYSFKNTGEIIIKNDELYRCYINAIVKYLLDNPKTSSRTLDEIHKKGDSFLKLLKPYGFPPEKKPENNSQNNNVDSQNQQPNLNNSANDSGVDNIQSVDNDNQNNAGIPSTNTNNSSENPNTRHSVKNKPSFKRKKIPAALKTLIDECYNLDQNNFANAKTALTRVAFECTLKYILENTNKPNGNPICKSNHFILAYKSSNHKPLPYTNFDILKTKFTELINERGIRKAFEDFDLQRSHQIIHNYRVSAVPADAKVLCDNLIDLLEFMLQDETDLLNSINISKL